MSNRQDPRLYVPYGHQRGLTEMEALQELVDKQGVDPVSHQWCKIFKENGWNFEHPGYVHHERADYIGQLAHYEPPRDYVPPVEPRGMSDADTQENQMRYSANRTWTLRHKHEDKINGDNIVDAEWRYADEQLPEGVPQLPSGQSEALHSGAEQLLYEIEQAQAEWRWNDYNRLVEEYCRR